MTLPYEPTNEERSERALAVVREYQRLIRTEDDTAVCDLLADLCHMCDWHRQFGSFDDHVKRAREHFIAERG